jgi:copper transport protein
MFRGTRGIKVYNPNWPSWWIGGWARGWTLVAGDRVVQGSAGALVRPRRRPRYAAGIVLATLIALITLLWLPARPALAHAVLLRSNPGQNARLSVSPPLVQLFFSEPLDHSFSTVQVRGSDGGRVDHGGVRFTADPTEMDLPLPNLPPGIYSVDWTSVSKVDGHRLQGSFPFTVLNPDGSTPAGGVAPAQTGGSAAPQPLDVVLRWLLLIGLLGSAGAFAFYTLVALPAAGGLQPEDREAAQVVMLRLLGLSGLALGAAGAVANLAILLRQAGQLGGLDSLSDLLASRTGSYWLLREAALLVLVLTGFVIRRKRERFSGPLTVLRYLGLVIGIGGIATIALTSHGAARPGAGWSVPSDLVHIVAVAFWLGSLVQLALLFRARGELKAAPRARCFSRLLGRFSLLASISIGAIVLTGLFNASVEVAAPGNLAETGYGQTLLVKVVLIVPLFAFGLLNAVWLAPRFERLADAGASTATTERRLRRTVAIEAGLGVAVLAVTALLVLLVPARDAAAQRRARLLPGTAISSVYRNTVPAGDMQATLVVNPNRVGENDFRVALTGPGLDQVTRVQLRFQQVGGPAGGSTIDAQPVSPGLWDVTAANLAQVGRWQIVVNVRRNGFDDVNGNFGVEVPDATGATVTATSSNGADVWSFPGRGISPNQTLGVVLVAAGVLLYRLRGPLRGLGRLAGRAVALGTAAAVIGGFMLFFATHSHGSPATAGPLVNPVPADQRSLSDGFQIYQQNCAVCHGSTGHGDGPNAATLNPKPVDLTVHVGLHPDSQLYDWITNGIPGTAMPTWRSDLTDQQRWDVINYLRTLSP